jgi:glucose/arabinose dehydrogenase
MNRIRRFDPDAADPQATLETVVSGLPGNRLHANRHPLSSFIFDADGSLLVNVGAPTDQCPPAPGATRCAEADGEGRRVHAAIWRFAYQGAGPGGAGRWEAAYTVFASGLRNSLAMVRTRAGSLLQAENSIDVADRLWPPEELNVLRAGARYGWPYCVGMGEVAPAWRAVPGVDCHGEQDPALLLPPHGAPLSLVEYHGAMFPQLEGRLLVSLHGYRPTGSRILALALDAEGLPVTSARPGYYVYAASGRAVRQAYGPGPAADGLVLTPGWSAIPGRRPAGSPVGMAVSADGAIWVAEDRNGAILRLARDRR